MELLADIAALGWSLLVISPFIYRMIDNWLEDLEEKNENNH